MTTRTTQVTFIVLTIFYYRNFWNVNTNISFLVFIRQTSYASYFVEIVLTTYNTRRKNFTEFFFIQKIFVVAFLTVVFFRIVFFTIRYWIILSCHTKSFITIVFVFTLLTHQICLLYIGFCFISNTSFYIWNYPTKIQRKNSKQITTEFNVMIFIANAALKFWQIQLLLIESAAIKQRNFQTYLLGFFLNQNIFSCTLRTSRLVLIHQTILNFSFSAKSVNVYIVKRIANCTAFSIFSVSFAVCELIVFNKTFFTRWTQHIILDTFLTYSFVFFAF